jgi:hypothetical protein
MKIKVKIEFTITVDAEAWMLNYGTEPQDVRADIKSYAEDIVRHQIDYVTGEGSCE